MPSKGHTATGRPKGRPRKDKALGAGGPKFGPFPLPGHNWGGARTGSGRKPVLDKHRKPQKQVPRAYASLDSDVARRIQSIPKGERTKYLKKAIELMLDLAPPETYTPAGTGGSDSPSGG